jgi:flagellar basal-body rod modification protein FlgD
MPEMIAGVAGPAPLHGSVDTAMSALGGMDSAGFLNLLVAQLRYQSPMDPKDPGDLMMQTAALAQLDATQQLLALQQRDLGMQQAVTAAGLVGTDITAALADGGQVSGVVDAVRYTAMGPVLRVGQHEVLLASITEIRRPGSPTSTPIDPTTPSTDPTATDPVAVNVPSTDA